jgi:hypothetical protein
MGRLKDNIFKKCGKKKFKKLGYRSYKACVKTGGNIHSAQFSDWSSEALEEEIDYAKRRMKVTGYGTKDTRELLAMEDELDGRPYEEDEE